MEEYDGKMDLKELLLGVDWVYLAQDNTWGGGVMCCCQNENKHSNSTKFFEFF